MPLRIGILSAAHVHAPSFVACSQANPESEVVGLWDDDAARGQAFADQRGIPFFADQGSLLQEVDAVVICSENLKHASHISAAAEADCHILCEKPIAGQESAIEEIRAAIAGKSKVFATAFPCPHSPNFTHLMSKLANQEIGTLLSVCATNQGTCPFGWFVDPSLSGGGAMIDHVVHVADLLRRLLGEDPVAVQAQIGNNHFGQNWEDTAMVTIEFASGRFATLDSSWSKPNGYRTWGNVALNLVGTKGVIEADLFVQGVGVTQENGLRLHGSGSNADQLMVNDFVRACLHGTAPTATFEDGIWASRVALAAYRSVASKGELAAV